MRPDGPDRRVAYVGPRAAPLPIPIVRADDAWTFATEEGIEELANHPHGDNAREFGIRVGLGQTPMAAIESATGNSVRLTPGRVGQFDVVAAGSVLFSKEKSGRVPEHLEVLEALGRMAALP